MGVNHTTGFSHNIKMGALKLCLILLFCVLQYHGSAAKCEDKYDECGLMSAAGGCQEEGEWGDFVKESCPKSCELCGEVKAHGFDAYLSGESCTPKTLNLKANPKLKKECEAPGCGKCEGNVPLPVDCKDACPAQCQKGAADGKCADKNSYIYQQCPESCGWERECRCRDWCEECKVWKKEGACERPYVFDKCRISCEDPTCVCKDTCPEACEDWADKNMCDIPWIDAHCAKSCEWENCTDPTPPTPPTTTPTIDCECQCEPFCHNQAAIGGCSDERVAKYCPCVCDPRCKNDPTTAKPDDGRCDELCTDSMGQFMIPGAPTKWCHCSNWLGYVKDCAACDKNQGHPLCDKYGALVFDDSTRQCDWPEIACKSRSDCPYTVVIAAVEKREYADCKFWAANGDCFTGPNCGTCDWQKWVCNNCPTHCPASCHSHNKPTPPTPTNDKYADCKFWAENGDCHPSANCGTCDWQYWVAANCPTSCAKH